MINREIKKLAKIMVKLTNQTRDCNPKHKMKLARILKRAFNIEKKMLAAIGRQFPLLDKKELDGRCNDVVEWMAERVKSRYGRVSHPTPPKV